MIEGDEDFDIYGGDEDDEDILIIGAQEAGKDGGPIDGARPRPPAPHFAQQQLPLKPSALSAPSAPASGASPPSATAPHQQQTRSNPPALNGSAGMPPKQFHQPPSTMASPMQGSFAGPMLPTGPVHQMGPRGMPLGAGYHPDFAPPNQFPPQPPPRAILIENLTWWTTDAQLISACQEGGIGQDLCVSELTFAEHRVNGKSKGAAFLLFKSSEAAIKALNLFQRMYVCYPDLYPPLLRGPPGVRSLSWSVVGDAFRIKLCKKHATTTIGL
ncbi:hypothetical protein DFJ73DRAFT_287519 [Zopfochytrium polystomum]|nr:hypothetical protein DFJ73DRAFT_287519 [Zopfochytrium polystomum]